jgi:hypothetical protein
MVMFIRTLVAAACFIVLLPCGAAAQQIGGGVKGGVTLGDVPKINAELLDEPSATTTWRTGYAVGGFLAIRFAGGFSIQPEVLYTQKGVKIEMSDSGGSGEVKLKADYVDVPILARYTFGKGVRGYVFAGPSLDFKVSAKMKVGVLGQSEEEDISEEVENFEFALVFGGGVELGPLLLEARWSEGLSNIAKADQGEPSTDVKTRTVLFLAGIRF